MLSTSASEIDFIALHNSFAPITLGKYDFNRSSKRLDAYLAMFAEARFASDDIRQVVAKFSEAGPRGNPDTAITEHFPLFGAGGSEDEMRNILDQSRTLASALYTASLFHVYMRENVWMANYNIVTSKWFGALVTDTDAGLVRTPTYHVFDLYRNHFGNTLVDCNVSGPSFSTKQVGVVDAADGLSVLDAIASTDQDGSIYLAVINRSLTTPQNASVQVQGIAAGNTAEVRTLAGPSPNAINGPALSKSTSSGPLDNVAVTSSAWVTTNSDYTFPSVIPDGLSVEAMNAPAVGKSAPDALLVEPRGWEKFRSTLAAALYRSIITHVPLHWVRQAFLRAAGMRIGRNVAILTGTTIIRPERISLGDGCMIGFDSFIGGEAGITIGNNVNISSQCLMLGGYHDPDDPNFVAILKPTVIEDYAWLATRVTVLAGVTIRTWRHCRHGRRCHKGCAALRNRSRYPSPQDQRTKSGGLQV